MPQAYKQQRLMNGRQEEDYCWRCQCYSSSKGSLCYETVAHSTVSKDSQNRVWLNRSFLAQSTFVRARVVRTAARVVT